MRQKSSSQLYFDCVLPSTVKIVREYRDKYEAIGAVLDANPEVVDLVHADLGENLSESEGGCTARYSSEQVLRVLVVMFVEGCSYRDTVVRIEESAFLRAFVGLGFLPMMSPSFLCRCFNAVRPETWDSVNRALAGYALAQERIGGDKLRLDTTAYETDIHYPTDASLLWDSFRTVARLVAHIKTSQPELGLRHRFHRRKTKRRMLYISRNAKSTSKGTRRRVKQTYRALLKDVRRAVDVAYAVIARADNANFFVQELLEYAPRIERVIDQTQRRVFDGETVPAREKVYSIFEPHTELLIRGKARKPVEFGHMVLVGQTREKFISQYRVLEHRVADTALVDEAVQTHERMFGKRTLSVLAADKGFYAEMDQLKRLGRRIETVSIAKKGKRNAQETEREHTEAFRAGQRFRAGVEGTISVLKRVFKLGRCLFKGFKRFAASVGCAVFCHNLVLLSRL